MNRAIGVRVLHVLNELNFSGAEVMLKEAAPVFNRAVGDIQILSTGSSLGPYAPLLRDAGYSLHHIPFARSLVYLVSFYRFVRNGRFSVVHIHSERAFFWYALLARLAGSKRVIRSLHTVFPFRGYLRMKKSILRWLARSVLNVKFVAIGSAIEENERTIFRNETLLIWNWVDQNHYCPSRDKREKAKVRGELELDDESFMILSVGSCLPVKNHRDIIAALALLLKDAENIQYLHVGEGPLLKDEAEFAQLAGVSELVRFAGQLVNVRDAYISADVFVIPSNYEGVSRACLEAKSCGLPVVAYDSRGLTELIDDGIDGFIVDPEPQAIAMKIGELMRDESTLQQISARARESVLRGFSLDASVSRLLQLYEGVS